MSKGDKSIRIRELNDLLRRTFTGGKVVMTDGVAALPEVDLAQLLAKVRSFDEFTNDNDPYGEHDFGSFELDGHHRTFSSWIITPRTWTAAPKIPPTPRRRRACSPSCARMNTDLRKEVFFFIPASRSERLALCAIGLYLASARPSRFHRLVPFGVTIPVAWSSNANDKPPRPPPILARRDPRASRRPAARAAKRPALTRHGRARRRDFVGSGRNVTLSHQEK